MSLPFLPWLRTRLSALAGLQTGPAGPRSPPGSPQPPAWEATGRSDAEAAAEPARSRGLYSLYRVPRYRPAEGSRVMPGHVPADRNAQLPRPAPGFRPRDTPVSQAPPPPTTPPPTNCHAPARPVVPAATPHSCRAPRLCCLAFLETGAASFSSQNSRPLEEIRPSGRGTYRVESSVYSRLFTMFPSELSV